MGAARGSHGHSAKRELDRLAASESIGLFGSHEQIFGVNEQVRGQVSD